MRLIRFISDKELDALISFETIEPIYETVVYFFIEDEAINYVNKTKFKSFFDYYEDNIENNIIFYSFIASDISGIKDYAIVVDIPEERIKMLGAKYTDPTYLFLNEESKGETIFIKEATVKSYSIDDLVEAYELSDNLFTIDRIY
jgi:hypothetical protein